MLGNEFRFEPDRSVVDPPNKLEKSVLPVDVLPVNVFPSNPLNKL